MKQVAQVWSNFAKRAFFGYKYKDGGNLKATLLGRTVFDDQTTHTSLGKKLGNCSTQTKR
jgi:hypothetical protein